MPVRPGYIRYPWKTSRAAAPSLTMTSAHGAPASVTVPGSSACAGCSLLTLSGPRALTLTDMHSPARHFA
ncbi:hypothetical protein ACFLWQ_004757, partial [Salmonella enterica]